MKKKISKLIQKLGFKISRYREFEIDFEAHECNIIRKIRPFTMTSHERLVSLIRAIDYIEDNKIDGSIVECGVWRGGSIMAAALRLNEKGNTSRHIYLYDTYEGMTEPTENDKDFLGMSAKNILKEQNKDKTTAESAWCKASLEDVKSNFATTGYPQSNVNFIKGKVEQTIPAILPLQIAILRLDTDWYESTKHELNFLFPLLVKGGVIIIDDYGYWQGAKQAVDEYFGNHKIQLLLSRVDYTGRIGIKQ